MSQKNKGYTRPMNLHSYNKQQEGAVLIIVLLILILIMLIGAMAIRGGTTDLKVSTAAQVNKLLFQSNDAAFMKVEREDRILESRRGSRDTLKGYMSSPQRIGHEVSFCIRPRSDRLFSLLEISEIDEEGELNASTSTKGYCNPTNDGDYVNEGRVITQMTFVRPIVVDDEHVFHREVEGTFSNDFKKPEDAGTSAAECTAFDGYVTSVIPSMAPSGVTMSAIGDCFTYPRVPNKKYPTYPRTVDECLAELGVPYQTQQQVYVNQPVGIRCISGS